MTPYADLLVTTGQIPPAAELVERGFAIRTQNERGAADYDISLYQLRARIEWARGKRVAAIADLRKSLNGIQAFLRRAIGSDVDRARFGNMEAYLDPYEKMVGWCEEAKDFATAFTAADECRSRVFLEQVTRNVDPLTATFARAAGQTGRAAEPGVRRSHAAGKPDRALDFAGDVSSGESAKDQVSWETQLTQARQALLDIYREIQDAGYDERTNRLGLKQATSVSDVRSWCTQTSSLWLEYLIGQKASYLLVIRPGGQEKAEVLKLQVTAEAAKRLKIEDGGPKAL